MSTNTRGPMAMEIGADVYHPCDIDILHFKVKGVRQYGDHNQYELKAVHNVGAQGKVVVLVADAGGRLQYIDCLEPSDDDNERGLDGFIDGEYFQDRRQAVAVFYTAQERLSWHSLEQKRRIYEHHMESHKRLVKTLAEARAALDASIITNNVTEIRS
jgi:hypothetical protein